MKTLASIILAITSLPVFAQNAPARLIVRGDDMGYSHAGNEAIVKCFKEGIESSVEILAPSPWFPEAVQLLAENPKIDVGVHLALSSEWDNIKWRPVSDSPSLRDPDGYFYPMIFPNKNYPGQSLVENKWRVEDVEKEFRAQIELVRKKVPRVSHLSYHMGCNSLGNEVKALVKKLAEEYRLDVEPGDFGALGVGYVGPHATSAEKIVGFIAMLKKLEPGKSYIFVDHPGLDTPEVRAIHHIGYENVAADRQGVTDTFTSPRVLEAIKTNNIQLIGYKDLVK